MNSIAFVLRVAIRAWRECSWSSVGNGSLNRAIRPSFAFQSISRPDGLKTEVPVGPAEGLKHGSVIRCDGLIGIPKAMLTNFVGTLAPSRLRELSRAMARALAIYSEDITNMELEVP